jgi:hypothetical protein
MKFLHVELLSLFLFVSACSTSTPVLKINRFKWVPPAQGVIRDKVAAKSIARAIWFSMNPSLKMSSEELWQSDTIATLAGGIWHVRQKPLGRNYLGGD